MNLLNFRHHYIKLDKILINVFYVTILSNLSRRNYYISYNKVWVANWVFLLPHLLTNSFFSIDNKFFTGFKHSDKSTSSSEELYDSSNLLSGKTTYIIL